MQWEASRGADYYIVQAFGVEEDETGCETSSLSCILPDLMCGFTYNISVRAVNSVCNVSSSEIKQLQAGKDDLWKIFWIYLDVSVIRVRVGEDYACVIKILLLSCLASVLINYQ